MLKPSLVALALAVGLLVNATVAAQNPSPSPSSSAAAKASRAGKSVIKPGDRHCLRSTGSLIPAKPGECLPVAGRSYSADELRRTGTNDNARALQTLDPSISVGH